MKLNIGVVRVACHRIGKEESLIVGQLELSSEAVLSSHWSVTLLECYGQRESQDFLYSTFLFISLRVICSRRGGHTSQQSQCVGACVVL